MPRFSQLFFYNFSYEETERLAGQSSTGSASRRAAYAYLQSRIQLESTCGISDVWYQFVESNRALYEDEAAPLFPLQRERHLRHLLIEGADLQHMACAFQWEKWCVYVRPQPKKKVPVPDPSVTNSSNDEPDEVMAASPVGPRQADEISDYEHEESRLDSVFSDDKGEVTAVKQEEEDPIIPAEDPGDDAARSQPVSAIAIKEEETDDEMFEPWPKTESFTLALCDAMGDMETVPEVLPVTANVFASSVSEERGLCLHPAEDQMEGVEPSQPSQVQVHAGAADASDAEVVGGGDAEAADMQDLGYTGDRKRKSGVHACSILTHLYSVQHGSP